MSSNLQQIQKKLLPYSAQLVAVSKTQPIEEIMRLFEQGQRVFGENRPQELASKYEKLPQEIEWHMIGHLQTNKVKLIASFVHLIHSVDSLRLLLEIEKQAAKNDRTIELLVQMKIGEEESKYGLQDEEAIIQFFESQELAAASHIRIKGVMGMASFVNDPIQIRREFKLLKYYFDLVKNRYYSGDMDFCEISMGMSADFEIALEEGSTMVRIGTLLFGARNA